MCPCFECQQPARESQVSGFVFTCLNSCYVLEVDAYCTEDVLAILLTPVTQTRNWYTRYWCTPLFHRTLRHKRKIILILRCECKWILMTHNITVMDCNYTAFLGIGLVGCDVPEIPTALLRDRVTASLLIKQSRVGVVRRGVLERVRKVSTKKNYDNFCTSNATNNNHISQSCCITRHLICVCACLFDLFTCTFIVHTL